MEGDDDNRACVLSRDLIRNFISRKIIELFLSCMLPWGTRAVIAIPRFGMNIMPTVYMG